MPNFPTINCAHNELEKRKSESGRREFCGRRGPRFDQSRAHYSTAKPEPSHRERQLELRSHKSIAIFQSLTMLRQQMIRSLKRPAFRAALNGSRALSASARRPADIELTIGLCHSPLRAARDANRRVRWKEGISRRYEVETHPAMPVATALTRPNSRLVPHPSLRPGRSYRPPILLPREVDDCWKLPYVLG